MFYSTFLAYKLIRKEQYVVSDIIILLSNAFIFYGFGYNLLYEHSEKHQWLGVFTVVNAILHLVVSQVIRRLGLADRRLFYLVLGLVIVFLTIAIPVQFDGNWVTLLWTAEAILVFVIGRTRQSALYERLGAGLFVLGFLSLLNDWVDHIGELKTIAPDTVHPFRNIVFITGLLACLAQGAAIWLNRYKKYKSQLNDDSIYKIFYDYILPVFFLVTGYFVFELEIRAYFHELARVVPATNKEIFGYWGSEVNAFGVVTTLLYSMIFVGIITYANLQWIKNRALAATSLVLIAILMSFLSFQGLGLLNRLSELSMFGKGSDSYFGDLNIAIRYVTILVMVLLIRGGRKMVSNYFNNRMTNSAWLFLTLAMALGFISAEYLDWASGAADKQYKLGLSIVWGLYALFLIVQGIRKKLKNLRLAAIVLFSITLLKLFLYDLAGAGTITRTVTFISLGAILLLVSYLYNRYKELLFGED